MLKNQLRDHQHCLLCKRRCALTFHHLIPKKLHRRTHFKKHYSKEALNQGIMICRPCHSGLHKLYSEMQLAKELNSIEAILADEAVMRHAQWVAKKKVDRPNC